MSHVIHENVEDYRTEDLNPLISCLLPHSVLVPEASSNLAEIRNDYENLLANMIEQLDELISQNITSSCDVKRGFLNRGCDLCKNASITDLTLCLKNNYTNIYPDLKKHMNTVSESTTKILNKNGHPSQRCHCKWCYRRCRKAIPLSSHKSLCCLKDVVFGLRIWWQKFFLS